MPSSVYSSLLKFLVEKRCQCIKLRDCRRGELDIWKEGGRDAGQWDLHRQVTMKKNDVTSYDQEVEGSHVYLSTSSRVAGAIDSLVWREKEFINGWPAFRIFFILVKTTIGHSPLSSISFWCFSESFGVAYRKNDETDFWIFYPFIKFQLGSWSSVTMRCHSETYIYNPYTFFKFKFCMLTA